MIMKQSDLYCIGLNCALFILIFLQKKSCLATAFAFFNVNKITFALIFKL